MKTTAQQIMTTATKAGANCYQVQPGVSNAGEVVVYGDLVAVRRTVALLGISIERIDDSRNLRLDNGSIVSVSEDKRASVSFWPAK